MNNLGLLILRLVAGGAMMTHGWPKFSNFAQYSTQFPDPIGLGSQISLTLAIFAELGCAALIVLGLLTRLSSIPLIVTMLVACFIVHGADPFAKQELSLIYLGMYLSILLMGPGHFSLSGILGVRKPLLR